ncbi:hypothetical protein FOA52_011011 [Chlamydomonas sp. UWO 241]|nr:hypothetical protein FOA52_011011 [Chlamydomonas sp. UWO 241]
MGAVNATNVALVARQPTIECIELWSGYSLVGDDLRLSQLARLASVKLVACPNVCPTSLTALHHACPRHPHTEAHRGTGLSQVDLQSLGTGACGVAADL